MRIVDVCAFYTPAGGGVKTYVERKLAAGPRFGHEIIILAPGEEDRVEERGPGARIVHIQAPRFPLDRAYRWFADEARVHRALDELEPDIVEASSPWKTSEIVASWAGRAPRSLVMHADPLSAYAYRWFGMVASRSMIDKSFGWYWRHLLRLDAAYDLIVSASDSLTTRLNEGGLTRVETNPMGVEPGVFAPALRDEKLRHEMLSSCALGTDGVLLLGVGRHAPEKRWPMVVEAVTAAGLSHPVALVLVGDGRERERIIRQAGGNPHIRLIEPINERAPLARLMASADALVHGCEAETFCMVAAEARASGLPLIAPDQGGASDQARSSGGDIYKSGNTRSMAAAIRRFAVRVDARRQRAATEAPRVRTMDDHFETLFARYSQLVNKGRRAA